MYRKVPALAALVFVASILTACTPRDANATPVVMFPTRVPFGGLPTTSFGTVLPPTPVSFIPTPLPTNAPPPTLFIPTQPGVTRIAVTAAPPTAIATIDGNWNQISVGIVWRQMTFRAPSSGQPATVLVSRFDPRYVRFRVNYFQGQVRDIGQWQAAIPSAVAIMNASFFDPQNRPLGLVATDNALYGALIPRTDTGLFLVQGGTPRVRSLFVEPYRSNEAFEQVVQGLPVLMVSGQVAPAFNPDLSTAADSRSVIAQDKQGRILFIVTQYSKVTISDMARFLGASGLELQSAINVDGGSSTAMYLATGGPSQFTLGLKKFPVSVAAFKR